MQIESVEIPEFYVLMRIRQCELEALIALLGDHGETSLEQDMYDTLVKALNSSYGS
jgi:hypothetical protein